MNATEMTGMLYEVGTRIKALREIAGYSVVYMAEHTTAPASSAWTSPT